MDQISALSFFELRVFILTYELRNASAVAKQLNLSASKVSRSLNSLRQHFDDPLFHRRQFQFEPTSLAVKLYPSAQRAVLIEEQLNQLVRGTSASAALEYHIHLPSMLCSAATSQLMHATKALGHNVKLTVHSSDEHSPKMLLDGGSDMVVSCQSLQIPQLDCDYICTGDGPRLIAREGHPIWQCPEDDRLSKILDYPFWVTSITGFNSKADPMEHFAMERGRILNKVGSSNLLSEVPSILLDSDAISFVSSHTISFFNDYPGIRCEEFAANEAELLKQSLKPANYYALTSQTASALPLWLRNAVYQLVKYGSVQVESA
ncbi:LysR family transcriptional regulator [Ferrimonas lipolytica]|uniref:LysR family transcriptional regulator n=1 Tax=Ferrimonas lipolytica TaxID=2724191 RepID=A0A6H1UEQ3_9GAMM|nr:LysR family transcriptional regulator [Ferrimonas lipolytica]QIZ77524.1 LysR family transcriptional regulator [Ferrimonas lipolytica]